MALEQGNVGDERQHEHVAEGARKRGYGAKHAKEIAGATVNEKRREEGRTSKSRGDRSKRG